MSTVKVKVLSVVIDYNIYPRAHVDNQHVAYLAEALASGATLPPIIIDKKSRRVVDGVHRCKGTLRHFGDDAEIEAIEKDYANEREMFLDSVELNSKHGQTLTRYDRVHCAIRGEELRVPKKALSKAMNMQLDKFISLVKERTAFIGNANEPIPLKQTISHMAGKKLTKDQGEANKRIGGMGQIFYVNHVIMFLESDLLNLENPKLMERVAVLYEVLQKFMGGNLSKK